MSSHQNPPTSPVYAQSQRVAAFKAIAQRVHALSQPKLQHALPLEEAAPWKRPSRAKDTTNQLDLDFSRRPDPEPAPKKKRAIDPSEVYTVLPRTEALKFARPLEQYIIDDNWDSESINGQNVESRVIGVLQNEIDGKVFYTVIYIMVHAEGLGNSTFKKRATLSPTIDSSWSVRTAYFADSRGKIMSLLKRQRQSIAYGRETRQKPPRLPDNRPRFFILDSFLMQNAEEPDTANMPDIPSVRERRVKMIKRQNALLQHGRKLPDYTSMRRYYRLDDLPTPGQVRAQGIDLWNKTAQKVGAQAVELRDIPQSALPDRPEDWPSDAVSLDPDRFTDYYDDEIDESLEEGLEHQLSRYATSPFLDPRQDRAIERFFSRQLDERLDLALRRTSAQLGAGYALKPERSIARLAYELEVQLALRPDLTIERPQVIDYARARGSSAYIATVLYLGDGQPNIAALRVAPDTVSNPVEMALPSYDANPDDILRSLRQMADTAMTSMDLMRAMRRYEASAGESVALELGEAADPQRAAQSKATSKAARDWLNTIRQGMNSPFHQHFLFLPSGQAPRASDPQVYFTFIPYDDGRVGIYGFARRDNDGRLLYLQTSNFRPAEEDLDSMVSRFKIVFGTAIFGSNLKLDASALRSAFIQLKRRFTVEEADDDSEGMGEGFWPKRRRNRRSWNKGQQSTADQPADSSKLPKPVKESRRPLKGRGYNTHSVWNEELEQAHRHAFMGEAIRIGTDGEIEIDYDADKARKRAQGDFKTQMRRSGKKAGRKIKGYNRKLTVAPGLKIDVIGAYSRTKDLPMELLQGIKAGAFTGSDQFVKRTALYMAAILRERGIKPDFLLPLPSRAGFPMRLAKYLLDYLPGARLLPQPPKIASVSSVWIPKRRAKAKQYYSEQPYPLPARTGGTILIVDDWFVTGSSIAAVADLLIDKQIAGEIGDIDALYGLVLGISSGSGSKKTDPYLTQAAPTA